MARKLVLGVILAILLGCDTGTAAPTMYAPDDLASVLPRHVGAITLEIVDTSRDDSVIQAYLEYAQGVPQSARQYPASLDLTLRFAKAEGIDDASGQPLAIYAIRVDGIPTTDEMALVDALGLGPSLVGETYRVEGQDVTWADHGEGAWSQLYQMGEVLFVAVGSTDLSVSVEDVLAALPRCQRKGREWLEPCRAPS